MDRTERREQVAILLATYNGGVFLRPQLESLRSQSVERIDVWASDDGSLDGTLTELRSFAEGWRKGRFEILQGPGTGFAENFRSLLARTDIEADYVAFCDQDDLWDTEKLAVALGWLRAQPPAVPTLFCTRTRLTDDSGQTIGHSPLFRRPPSLQNALVQSIAGGNTMVFNRAAHALLSETARRTGFLTHDWWAYLAVTAAGGKVFYSPVAHIGYRQHPENVVGANDSWVARAGRLDLLLRGRFAAWTDMNLSALDACADLLTPEALAMVAEFRAMRLRNVLSRLTSLRQLGLHRQTALGQLSLYAACLLNRL